VYTRRGEVQSESHDVGHAVGSDDTSLGRQEEVNMNKDFMVLLKEEMRSIL